MKLFSYLLIVIVCYSVSGQAIAPLFPISTNQLKETPQKTFEDVKNLILTNYYTTTLTENDLYWAGIQGMLRHISPPENPDLARIWTPEEYENILNSLKGVKVSLGFKSSFSTNDGSLTITEILDNSPSVGKLQLYDRIVRINGLTLKGMGINEVNGLLDGTEGTEVRLKIIRDVEILDFKIKRVAFPSNDLKVSILPERPIALIEIKAISVGVAEKLKTELQTLKSNGISKILLDLRSNPGGVLNEGVNIANLFLTKNNIIVRTTSRGSKTTPIVADNETPFEFEIIVLINSKTASASEIIASALQDQKKAQLIGTKTYGKGVIETTYTLESQYRVKFITSAMYSPLGRSWQATGILPDFLVEQDPSESESLAKQSISYRAANDIFLLTGIKLLTD